MSVETLNRRALNRATLERQWLLRRTQSTPVRAMEQVVGLQAQLPRPPFIGLWSRLEGIDREDLVRQLLDRTIVRATTLRGTLHLLSASDYLRFRKCLQPGLDRGIRLVHKRAAGVDLDAVVDTAARFFDQPHTFDALRDHLALKYPKADIRALAYAARIRVPLVQVPKDAAWGFPPCTDFVLATKWLGQATSDDAVETLVVRYLAAFGPASVADMQAWSGLPNLKPVFGALRPKLRSFKDERGAELFDLPDAPRPGGDVPSPVRFVPEYDNLIVGRADDRILAAEHRSAVFLPGLRVLPTFLVDGFAAGIWKIERKGRVATLLIGPFKALPKRARAELEAEGAALLKFVEPTARVADIRIE